MWNECNYLNKAIFYLNKNRVVDQTTKRLVLVLPLPTFIGHTKDNYQQFGVNLVSSIRLRNYKDSLVEVMFGTPSSNLTSYNISLFKKLVLLFAGVAVLAISAHIKVPFYPVPITMQTLVVMLIGFTYGIRLGSSTVLVYLALGAIGAPVFAGGAGLTYMSGPTGGYLFGFLVAVYLIGYFTEQGYGRTFISTLFLALLGTIVFYLFGVAWLTTILGFEKAIKFGLLPFLYGDILKLFLLAFSIPATWKLVLKLSKRDS